MKLMLTMAALAALSLAPPPDVVQVGDLGPEVGGEWFLSKASSLEDVRGRVVLLDFWRTW